VAVAGATAIGVFKFVAWVRMTEIAETIEKDKSKSYKEQVQRERERERGRERKRERERERKGSKRGMIAQREKSYGPYREREREREREEGGEGQRRLQHCKRQRCTLPGGRSDNIYRGPPATIPIFRGKKRDRNIQSRKRRGKLSRILLLVLIFPLVA